MINTDAARKMPKCHKNTEKKSKRDLKDDAGWEQVYFSALLFHQRDELCVECALVRENAQNWAFIS